jgi:RimJ/RimL family protein N-acetyltransferase
MEIRKSNQSDLEDILILYQQAREFMKDHGNPNQWGNHYPEASVIEEDIAKGRGYVCMDEGQAVGTFMFAVGADETYANIYQGEWLSDEPYAVIHRITASAEKRGVATFCLNWCFNQYQNLRIDTHRDNIPMQNLLKKNGFIPCGIIYLKNGDERIAFQKVNR